jgi:3-phosphoshikimate 1-carboxyvinyltransferase
MQIHVKPKKNLSSKSSKTTSDTSSNKDALVTIRVPGDKSISHRSLIFGALSEGETKVRGILRGADVMSTWHSLQKVGVKIFERGDEVIVEGCSGKFPMSDPKKSKGEEVTCDCGNSGTTMRLLMGVFAASAGLKVKMIGDESLQKRPMKRVADPLSKMGAKIQLTRDNLAPLSIQGESLQAFSYQLPVASAQLKSALLLAGLLSQGKEQTVLTGKISGRDHTERMINDFGGEIQVEAGAIRISGGQKLKGTEVVVPGDPSSAAFWIAACLITPGSKVCIADISLNPTRLGFVRAVERMGAKIELKYAKVAGDPYGSIIVQHSELKGIEIEESEVPDLIDEIPMLSVLATFAKGQTTIRGAEELRVKESDRIVAICQNLQKMGATVKELPDGLVVTGPTEFQGGLVESFHDHRIAMAFAIGALRAKNLLTINDAECVRISYPGFYQELARWADVDSPEEI